MSLPLKVARKGFSAMRVGIGWPRAHREMPLVEDAYESELGRPIDAMGRRSWSRRIARGETSGGAAVAELRESAEYRLWRTGFYERLHRARMQWVASLGAFDTILDIGGSSPTDPNGALIELGYPHRPSELIILDRPEQEQFSGAPQYDQRVQRANDWGTVTFHHGYAEDVVTIDTLNERQFDAVFMGQTIEHIDVGSLRDVLSFIRTHLGPGGRFIFDTPNRALTRLIMGDDLYLTDDHTYEFTPHEMAELLLRHGFHVSRRTGMLPMPRSVESGTFDAHEATVDCLVTEDNVDDSFVFAFDCSVA